MRRLQTLQQPSRAGASLVLMMIVIPMLLILTGFVIDLSRVYLVKNQLQASADAGALSGATMMRPVGTELETYRFSLGDEQLDDVRPVIQRVIASNAAAHLEPGHSQQLFVDANSGNVASGDIVLGHYAEDNGFLPSDSEVNAVQVVTRFAEGHANGNLPLLFGNLLNRNAMGLWATAVAKIERPTLLPFLVYQPQWDALTAGFGSDGFRVNPSTNGVTAGSDGIKEIRVFPAQWEGLDMPPGNYGWFDLGGSSGTAELRQQIDAGPNSDDMKAFGGVIQAGDYVTGISGRHAGAAMAFTGGKAEKHYSGIIGQPRVVALFDEVSGQGTNAQFRITRFVLARVVAADFSSQSGGIVVQPITQQDDGYRVSLVQ